MLTDEQKQRLESFISNPYIAAQGFKYNSCFGLDFHINVLSFSFYSLLLNSKDKIVNVYSNWSLEYKAFKDVKYQLHLGKNEIPAFNPEPAYVSVLSHDKEPIKLYFYYNAFNKDIIVHLTKKEITEVVYIVYRLKAGDFHNPSVLTALLNSALTHSDDQDFYECVVTH